EALARDAGFARENWRGVRLATGVGAVLPLAGAAGGAAAFLATGPWPGAAAGMFFVAAAALFGLIDDVLDRDRRRGWGAHAAGLLRGRWTGGTVKLVGIPAAALAAGTFCTGGTAGPGGAAHVLAALAAAVAAAGTANAVNLTDTRPGRALKIWYLAAIGLGLAGPREASAWLLPWAAAALPLLARDLSEGAMIGDAGSNALGAALGMGLVFAAPGPELLAVIALVLAGLQVLGDRRSLHAWIEGRSWLRAFDTLGRWRPPAAGNLSRFR